MQLVAGQNIPLQTNNFVLALDVGQVPSGFAVDTCAFALAANEKVRNDHDFIFFNNPQLVGQGIVREQDGQLFKLNLDKLPADIAKVAITITIENGVTKRQNISSIGHVVAMLKDDTGSLLSEFRVDTATRTEVALILVELYRRNGTWKLRALGQGFAGGLQSLAEHYGVDIDEAEEGNVVSSPPSQPIAPVAPDPMRVGSVSLDKVILEKRGMSISLEKSASNTFGEIQVNLNWHAREQQPVRTGFLSQWMGTDKPIDLNLGCLFEHANGEQHLIQALGDCLGTYNDTPWVCLDGDDRGNRSTSSETLRINGAHWQDFKRILVYAFIYQGALNWTETQACINIKVPQQPEIEVELDNHQNSQGMCAVALLENIDGAIKVTKLMDYFRDHRTMDQAYEFGLHWSTAEK